MAGRRLRSSLSPRPRRLQAQPSLASRFAVHASARADIRRAVAEIPQELSVEALTAAYDAWLEGTVATTVKDGIATIPVRGVLTKGWSFWNYWLGWSSYDQLAHDLDVALADPGVRAIILNVDSPGGQVDGCAELATRLLAAREELTGKPILAHVDGLAASAAYWLASAAERVIVAPTAMAGSIGVIFSFTDWAGAYEAIGVRSTEIVSTQSPKKNPDPFEAEGRAQYQVHADAIAEVFLQAVATHRGTSRDTVAAQFGQGDLFVGQAAIDAGLADALGTFEATQRALAAELDASAAELITLQFARSDARANPARVVSALSAAVAHAVTVAPPTTQEDAMAGTQPTGRSAAADPAEDETELPPSETPADEQQPSAEDTEDTATEAAQDEDTDEEVVALTRAHSAVVARIRTQAATAERARIAGIRALGRVGQEAVLQACIDNAACTVEKAALALLQHDQGQRAAHLRGVRAEEQALDAPDHHATPEASGDAAVVGSIVSLLHANTRRPSTAGRA